MRPPEGRLPNFGRILDAGAVAISRRSIRRRRKRCGRRSRPANCRRKTACDRRPIYRLAGRPADTPIQLLPDYCFAYRLLRFGFLTEEPQNARRAPSAPVVDASSALPASASGVVNLPLTYPAPAVRGFVVSDAYLAVARRRRRSGRSRDASIRRHRSTKRPRRYCRRPTTAVGAAGAERRRAERHQAPARIDRLYERLDQATGGDASGAGLADALSESRSDRSLLPALRDAVAVRRRQRRRAAAVRRVLEAHYALVDEAIGRAIAALGPDDLLLVVSGYGMEPLGVEQAAARAGDWRSGDQRHRTSGARRLSDRVWRIGGARASSCDGRPIVDVLPTILYFLGLPVGARHGRLCASPICSCRRSPRSGPITFIPTYDK